MPLTAPLYFEREGWEQGLERIVGIDEAGCGPLAGPVVAAGVALHCEQLFDGVVDSKQLTARIREELAEEIHSNALAVAVAAASTREIERLNIRRATCLAMQRVLTRLPFRPDLVLVDGRRMAGLARHTAIVRGDQRSHSIACASILSKVVRDRLMRRLDPRYPQYGWATNKGYATTDHLAALAQHGPTPHHRRTFTPVVQMELALQAR